MYSLLAFVLAANIAASDQQWTRDNQNHNQNANNQNQKVNFDGPKPSGYETTLARFDNFDNDLFQYYASADQNFFMSPTSIKAVLVMLLEGSMGKTYDEIALHLRIKSPPEHLKEIRPLLAKNLVHLTDPSGQTIVETSNAIFVSEEERVRANYKKLLEEYYKGIVQQVDFEDKYSSTEAINQLVKTATRGKIPHLLTPGSLGPDTRMVVINALYFKGLWKTAFENTMPGCFESLKTKCINVEMMHVEDTFNYQFIPQLDSHVVELPYNGGVYSMILIIPSQKQGIKVLHKDLQRLSFSNIVKSLERAEIMLALPKFELDFTTDAADALQHFGIREIFTPNANVHGIIESSNAYLSKFIHKAKVEVNEKGTEAAAVSGAVFIPLMGSSKPKIVADHPFAFFIYHKPTDSIVFQGALFEPAEVHNTAQKTDTYGHGTSYQKPQETNHKNDYDTNNSNNQRSLHENTQNSNTNSNFEGSVRNRYDNTPRTQYEGTQRNQYDEVQRTQYENNQRAQYENNQRTQYDNDRTRYQGAQSNEYERPLTSRPKVITSDDSQRRVASNDGNQRYNSETPRRNSAPSPVSIAIPELISRSNINSPVNWSPPQPTGYNNPPNDFRGPPDSFNGPPGGFNGPAGNVPYRALYPQV